MSTSNGMIYKTTDGGNTWLQVNNAYPIRSIQFINSLIVWAVGDNGSVFKSMNGGDTWSSVFVNAITPFKKVAFKDVNNGIIVGDFGIIYTTTNGGIIWTSNSTFTGVNYPQILGIAHVPNTTNIWIVGYNSNTSTTFVAKSLNNGRLGLMYLCHQELVF